MFNVRVYGILLGENGQVLVTDELIRGAYITKFPGGGLEFGEGTRDCLKREFKEEMDLDVEVGDHLYTTDFFQMSAFQPGTPDHLHLLLGKGPGTHQSTAAAKTIRLRRTRTEDLCGKKGDRNVPLHRCRRFQRRQRDPAYRQGRGEVDQPQPSTGFAGLPSSSNSMKVRSSQRPNL
jgi:8-oxo-dGTP pyrophosphatase MutT (NUDIX family)